MKILFVTFGLPYPPDDGVSIHDFNLIKNISGHHTVLLLSLTTYRGQVKYFPHLKPYCALSAVVETRRRSTIEHLFAIIRNLLRGFPLATYPFIYDEMISKIQGVLKSEDVDIIQIEHSFLAPYVGAVAPEDKCKTVLSFHNLGVRQYRRMLKVRTGFVEKLFFVLKWILMLRWESRWAQKFNRSLVVSPLEKELLQEANAKLSVSLIENGVDTDLYRPLAEVPEDYNILFVGTMGYLPNVDAVLYFYHEIMSLILHEISDAKLIVVGHHPPSEIRKLEGQDNVVIKGGVEDVIPYYLGAKISIVPLRAGGGTRLKILESMALGRPVVSTSLGCEGLNVIDNENIMIADTPAQFAERVIGLLSDKVLRDTISDNARGLVEEHYDWQIISRKLMDVYDDLVQQL